GVYGPNHAALLVGAPTYDAGGPSTDDRGAAYLFDCISTTSVGTAPPVTAPFLAWPNPARDRIQLAFALERESPVAVKVFDVSGRCVADLFTNQWLASGRTMREWTPSNLPGGIYRLRGRIGGREFSRRLIWLAGR